MWNLNWEEILDELIIHVQS